MKKSFIAISLALTSLFGIHADTVTMHSPQNFQLLSVSANGKWACGVFIDNSMNTFGFRWNLESDEIEMLGATVSTAWDVSNDGTVSGDFMDPLGSPNGAPVSMPGYWRDGEWHHMQMPEGSGYDGIGACISPDGQYMAGSIPVNGRYTACIWKNGEVHRVLNTGSDAVAYAVSPDGNAAAGFNTQYNRTCCYWSPDGSLTYFMDSPDYSQTPWSYARNFSPDGSKLVYWGGWEVEYNGEEETLENAEVYLYAMYDLTTGQRIRVKAPSYDSDLEFYDVSNSGLLVGQSNSHGYVSYGGVVYTVEEYLASRGVDLSDFDDFYYGDEYNKSQIPIYNIVSVDAQEKVFACLYYNTRGQMSSMILKVDQDLSEVAPAAVRASQLSGLNTVGLSWKRPVGANSIRGYNVYRNGVKVSGFMPLNVPYFYDRNLAPGTYEYQVGAVNLSGVETRSGIVSIDVEEVNLIQSPLSIFARQKGVDGAHLSWKTPMSNIIHRSYFNPDNAKISGFCVYEPFEVEMAVRYDKAELANYAGSQISEVSFWPMAPHDNWKVSLYTIDEDGFLSQIVSQPITQTLHYNSLNTVVLDEPVSLPSGDLLVAISMVGDYDIVQTIGAIEGKSTAGYTDLLRLVDEPEFYSAFDASAMSGISISSITWAIDFGLKNPSTSVDNTLVKYNVYLDDVLKGLTDNCYFETDDLREGIHSVAIEAEYADGAVSPAAKTSLNVANNYPRVEMPDVEVSEGSSVIKASWIAPVDDDYTNISYVNAEKHSEGIMGVASNDYSFMASAIYPAEMMRGLEGYKVRKLRFYPLANANFTYSLYENNEMVYSIPVQDYALNQWNDITVDEDITINPDCSYQLVLDCYTPDPEVKVLAIDNSVPRSMVSDLYSIDDGDNWNSLLMDASATGSWMIGFTVSDAVAKPLEVSGYDVIIDRKKCNPSLLTSTSFDYDMGKADDSSHSVRVDVHYPARTQAVNGATTYFYLSSGINDAIVSTITLRGGDNWLVAEGDGVTALSLIATDGITVASATGNKLSLSGIHPGIYIAQIHIGDKLISRKLLID